MNEYSPDKWLILEVFPDDESAPYLKVFGTWAGGYLSGDSWRVNSSVTEITQDEDYYYFHGASGSVYKCHKNSYGVAGASNNYLIKDFTSQEGVRVLEWDEVVNEANK